MIIERILMYGTPYRTRIYKTLTVSSGAQLLCGVYGHDSHSGEYGERSDYEHDFYEREPSVHPRHWFLSSNHTTLSHTVLAKDCDGG
jgi:hypothetical protein